MPVIHWFRRDLRLSDNVALNAAIHKHGGVVIPVFILMVITCAGSSRSWRTYL
jgi:deoxyribodipyrimidine photolyase